MGLDTAEAIALFRSVERDFPSSTVGHDKWYLLVLSALTYCEPDLAATLYTYLIENAGAGSNSSTPSERQALTRRLRECLVKNVALMGVCKPIEAVFAISKVEREEDRDFSFSREHWQSGPENTERGSKWLDRIYLQNKAQPFEVFAAHKDFAWISDTITYGLYLSDHSILNDVETEIVVLTGILIQNLPLETAWHLRGLRRVGVSNADVESIHKCIETVAKFVGQRVDRVPRVNDVEHEV